MPQPENHLCYSRIQLVRALVQTKRGQLHVNVKLVADVAE